MSRKFSTSVEQHERTWSAWGNLAELIKADMTEKENSEEWKHTLEYSLRTTDWILDKVRQSDDYAKMLYAALCNNEFIKNETFDLLSEKTWSCSWRYAGGIIAHMRKQGDYMDWYCAGNEGIVEEVIREDLLKLGWVVKGLTY